MISRADQKAPSLEHSAIPDRELLRQLLRDSAEMHQHLCPRQVLGVRLGLRALRALQLSGQGNLPRFLNHDKRLLTFVETDGCGADGIAVAVGCSVGRRTMRVYDFGKVAATLVDTHSGRAVRVSPTPESRKLALRNAPETLDHWHAYLSAYQIIPDEELVRVQEVSLLQPLEEILSNPEARAMCDVCGEEIINEREVRDGTATLCRYCAGHGYYRPLDRDGS